MPPGGPHPAPLPQAGEGEGRSAAAEEPLTLSGDGESFTFVGQAWMRIGKEKIRVSGDLRSMRLKLSGRRIVEINGKEIAVRFENGVLSVGP